MYKIIKEIVNSNDNVIESKEFITTNEIKSLMSLLSKLKAVINDKYVIDGSDYRCQFRIVEIKSFDESFVKDYIKNEISKGVNEINRIIRYKNDSAIISARKCNKDKVQLIKELKLEDYLYPTTLITRVIECSNGLILK